MKGPMFDGFKASFCNRTKKVHFDPPCGDCVRVKVQDARAMTAEQAIAATLGRISSVNDAMPEQRIIDTYLPPGFRAEFKGGKFRVKKSALAKKPVKA